MGTNHYVTVDSVEMLEDALSRVRKAQKEYSAYTQEQVFPPARP